MVGEGGSCLLGGCGAGALCEFARTVVRGLWILNSGFDFLGLEFASVLSTSTLINDSPLSDMRL